MCAAPAEMVALEASSTSRTLLGVFGCSAACLNMSLMFLLFVRPFWPSLCQDTKHFCKDPFKRELAAQGTNINGDQPVDYLSFRRHLVALFCTWHRGCSSLKICEVL